MEKVMCAVLITGGDCIFKLTEDGQWEHPFVVALVPTETALSLQFAPLINFSDKRTIPPMHPSTYFCLYEVEPAMAEKYDAFIDDWREATQKRREAWEKNREADAAFKEEVKRLEAEGKIVTSSLKGDC